MDEVATIAQGLTEAQRLDREDAERWRAFISSDRFYVMGWAGFTNDPESPEVKPDHDPKDWLHFTLNVWDQHPAGDDRQGRHGRALLLAYVEHRRLALRTHLQGEKKS